MKLTLKNTAQGLVPMYDDDYEEKRKLKIGKEYVVTIKLARNLDFHRKYFALIKCAWEYQNEKTVEHFKSNMDQFRKTIEIASGHCDTVYLISKKEFVDVPKSISFDKMDNAEFADMYNRVKDVIYKIFLKKITVEEFEKELINF